MCLFVHPDTEAVIAKEDITVYKVLQKLLPTHRNYFYYHEKLLSPFRKFVYEPDEVYYSELSPESKGVVKVVDNWDNYPSVPTDLTDFMTDKVSDVNVIGMVNVGIHTFSSINDAQLMIDTNRAWEDEKDSKLVVAKCIIPKGTLYYEGEWVLHKFPFDKECKLTKAMGSYSSKCLKIVEIME